MNPIEIFQRRREDALAAGHAIIDRARLEGRDLSPIELDEVKAHRRSADSADAGVVEQASLRSRMARAAEQRERFGSAVSPSLQITRAEGTYRPDADGPSFFRDLVSAKQGDGEAIERLARNNAEGADRERRDGTTGATSMGSFIPPVWLVSEVAMLARAGRILASLVTDAGEPQTNSVVVPRVTTGATQAGQAGDNAAVSETDIVTAQITRSTITIAGQQDVSIQSIELGTAAVDKIIFGDLMAAYQAELDRQILRGSGTNELLGINQVSGINAISYTDGTPTVPELYPKVADAIQQSAVGRKLAPTAMVMHPRRWGWITAALDSQTRPLVVPSGSAFNAAATFQSAAKEGQVGELQGLPVYGDSNVATNLGGGTEDQIVVFHGPSVLLLESPIRTRIMQEVLSGTLTLRFQLFAYVNLFAGRYPTSISTIGSTGLIAPTF
jgi:HK97 family phage major capsid protein